MRRWRIDWVLVYMGALSFVGLVLLAIVIGTGR